MKGKTVTIQANWSITNQRETATVLECDRDLNCLVEYISTGYQETLPISAFEGY